MSSTIDYTSPTTQFSFNVNDSTLFKKDNQKFINVLGVDQLTRLKMFHCLIFF